ncbi:hypothetical protein CLU79DRAFT_740073, partial [Phycomyces nitens]
MVKLSHDSPIIAVGTKRLLNFHSTADQNAFGLIREKDPHQYYMYICICIFQSIYGACQLKYVEQLCCQSIKM